MKALVALFLAGLVLGALAADSDEITDPYSATPPGSAPEEQDSDDSEDGSDEPGLTAGQRKISTSSQQIPVDGYYAKADTEEVEGEKCASAKTCEECVGCKTCGWCAVEGKCIDGDMEGPHIHRAAVKAPDLKCGVWDFGYCTGEPCAAKTEMGQGACIETKFCGWCESLQICTEGNTNGPTFGSCQSGWKSNTQPYGVEDSEVKCGDHNKDHPKCFKSKNPPVPELPCRPKCCEEKPKCPPKPACPPKPKCCEAKAKCAEHEKPHCEKKCPEAPKCEEKPKCSAKCDTHPKCGGGAAGGDDTTSKAEEAAVAEATAEEQAKPASLDEQVYGGRDLLRRHD